MLGEHVELHMLVGTIKRGCSLQGYIDNKLIDTTKIQERHEALVKEMTLRGYKHNSPLTYVDTLNLGSGLISETASLSELSRRCPECARRQLDDEMVARLLKEHYGELPKYASGPNTGRLDRNQIASKYSYTLKEVTKAYLNWQDTFRIEGSTLTFEQYLNKLYRAGLTPSDIGNKKGQFNLSRHNDTGPYNNESCRFLSRVENIREQKNLFGK